MHSLKSYCIYALPLQQQLMTSRRSTERHECVLCATHAGQSPSDPPLECELFEMRRVIKKSATRILPTNAATRAISSRQTMDLVEHAIRWCKGWRVTRRRSCRRPAAVSTGASGGRECTKWRLAVVLPPRSSHWVITGFRSSHLAADASFWYFAKLAGQMKFAGRANEICSHIFVCISGGFQRGKKLGMGGGIC